MLTAIIREFLTQLVRCPACDDTGSITVGREVIFPTTRAPSGEMPDTYVEEGAIRSCPVCGGLDEQRIARHDPTHVIWYCRNQDSEAKCRSKSEDRHKHEHCGYRMLLPLNLFDDADQ